MIRQFRLAALACAASLLFASASVQAQQPVPHFPNMTFFITSVGGPAGPTTAASKARNAWHPSRACDAASLIATSGDGLLY